MRLYGSYRVAYRPSQHIHTDRTLTTTDSHVNRVSVFSWQAELFAGQLRYIIWRFAMRAEAAHQTLGGNACNCRGEQKRLNAP